MGDDARASAKVGHDLAALAGLALSEEAAARLARQAEGLRASVAKLGGMDLHDVEPAALFTLDDEGVHA
jgi:Asp-tRNA(Asn)/Glu-tRNA(Gln) amidotransferase C subunit